MIIKLDNIGNNKKGKIWLNDEPNAVYSGDSIITAEINTNNNREWDEKIIALELCLPRNNSNYALLGVKYFPKENSKKILVKIEMTSDKEKKYTETLAMSIENVYIGILPEYAESIMKTVCNFLECNQSIPAGELIFNIGAHGEIGSSCGLFSVMAKAILKILSRELDGKNENDVQAVVKEAIEF